MDRDKNGRFAAGNTFGPGRPKRQTERGYLRATVKACSIDDWQAIVKTAVVDAKMGDAKAREWLGRYLVGEPGPGRLLTLLVDDLTGDDQVRAAVSARYEFDMMAAFANQVDMQAWARRAQEQRQGHVAADQRLE